jgi:hypothetical protein
MRQQQCRFSAPLRPLPKAWRDGAASESAHRMSTRTNGLVPHHWRGVRILNYVVQYGVALLDDRWTKTVGHEGGGVFYRYGFGRHSGQIEPRLNCCAL